MIVVVTWAKGYPRCQHSHLRGIMSGRIITSESTIPKPSRGVQKHCTSLGQAGTFWSAAFESSKEPPQTSSRREATECWIPIASVVAPFMIGSSHRKQDLIGLSCNPAGASAPLRQTPCKGKCVHHLPISEMIVVRTTRGVDGRKWE